ncbi:uncharacterized protein LOC144367764 isoform X2 [Ictidomys tridecemlineatus]
MELQVEEDMNEVLMDSLKEVLLAHSSCHDLSHFSGLPSKSPASLSEEHVVYSTLDGASEYTASMKKSSETGSGSIIYQNRTAYSPGLQNKASFYGTRIGPLKLQEDEDASFFLSRHIKDLLIQHDPEGHREELAEEHKLAEHFVRCPEALLTERCSKVPSS